MTYSPNRLLLILSALLIASVHSFSQSNIIEPEPITEKCSVILQTIEKHLFLSCPISKGLGPVYTFFNGTPTFTRNFRMSYDGDYSGHAIYEAKNASIAGYNLIDDKSLFAISYSASGDFNKVLSSVTVRYYLQNADAKNNLFNKMVKLSDKTLGVKHNLLYDKHNNPFVKYSLPCGSWMSVEQSGVQSAEHSISLSWAPGIKKQPEVPQPPDMPIEQLLAAPDTIRIANNKLYLIAHLSMDYMPTIPSSGPRSYLTVRIKSDNHLAIPSSITTDAVWVINEDKAWKSWLPKEPAEHVVVKPNEIERSVNKGPGFGPNIYVNVIVRVNDGKGKSYLLRASKQFIRRTE